MRWGGGKRQKEAAKGCASRAADPAATFRRSSSRRPVCSRPFIPGRLAARLLLRPFLGIFRPRVGSKDGAGGT